ncbi:spore coat U domain-containing protein, partial [Acinetobacter sp. YH16039]|uniref:Csu type fimbrial protein n=1 Tax=Acinetobacter sp. YH16039 TaxID=2601184 RepID=UPI0015D2A077
MKKFITTALLVSTNLLLAGQASAETPAASTQQAQTTFDVKIEVLSTCSINATEIDFGKVNSGSVASDKTGTLNVTCTNQTPYSVGLSGSGKMTNEKDALSSIAYELFQDSNKPWDNNDNKYANNGSGNVQAIPVIANVVGSTNVRAGNYKDTVTATVTY